MHRSDLTLASHGPEPVAFDRIVPGQPTLDAFAVEATCSHGVALQSLEAGAVLTVNTQNSCYRMVVLDGPARRVLVRGGWVFPEKTEAQVGGATAGGSAVRVGWIGEGLRLELFADIGPVTTSLVQSVTIEDETESLQ